MEKVTYSVMIVPEENVMENCYIEKIKADTVHDEAPIQETALNLGVDLNDPGSIQAFLRANPGFSLPDVYFQIGHSQNIYINYHYPVFNNIPHRHNYFEINYVGRGSAQDYIDHTAIDLQEGELCINNPLAEHMITRCGPDDFLVNILISKEVFQKEIITPVDEDPAMDRFFLHYMTGPDTSPNYMAFHNPPAEVDRIFNMIFEEYFHPHRSELLITSLMTLLFGNLLRDYHSNSQAAAFADYLASHLQDATIQDMAKHFGYHEKYLSRLIREKTGRTFKQQLTEIRMRRAVHLLLYSQRSVEEIAGEVGYLDPSTFYGNFRKVYGVSPGQYRAEKTQKIHRLQ